MKKISPYIYPLLKHYLLPKEYVKNDRMLTSKDVIDAILTQYQDSENFLFIKSRKRKYVEPKKIYCKLCVDFLNMTNIDIASGIVSYDHSVVIYSRETFDDLFKFNYTFRHKVIKILNILGIDEKKLTKTHSNETIY